MAQWIGIIITGLAMLIGFWQRSIRDAETRALLQSQVDYMKGELIELRNQSQTEGERDAIARAAELQLRAHEREDNIRFENVTAALSAVHGRLGAMDGKMDKILDAVNGHHKA